MRIIALMNQKGGVGKTTTTVNLGAALAEAGQRVLLVDIDPQAHLTINYGLEPSAELPSLYDVLVDEKPLRDAIHVVGERIAVVPSSIDLAGAEIELVSILGREMLLKKRIEAAAISGEYDFILFDCAPSLGLLTINALAVATEVIIPMLPHFLALQGMAKLLETIQLVGKRMNPRLKVSGVVLTMFDPQVKLSNEIVSEIQGFIDSAKDMNMPWSDAQIFQTRIRRNIKLAECPSFGQTILAYGPTTNGAADYRALAKEVIAMSAGSAREMSGAVLNSGATNAAAVPIATTVAPAASAIAPTVSVSVNSAIDQSALRATSIAKSLVPQPVAKPEVAA